MKHGFGISNILWEGGKVITPSMRLCMETFSAARMQECVLREGHRESCGGETESGCMGDAAFIGKPPDVVSVGMSAGVPCSPSPLKSQEGRHC